MEDESYFATLIRSAEAEAEAETLAVDVASESKSDSALTLVPTVIVMSLDVHERNPVHMWAQLAVDYNTVTPEQIAARKEFLTFVITEEETFLNIKQKYNESLRKVTVKGGVVDAGDRLKTLLNALPEKYDILSESYFAQTPAPGIEYVWDRMYDIETTEKENRSERGVSRGWRKLLSNC